MSHFEMLRPLPVVAESDCQQGQSASSPARHLENSQGEGLLPWLPCLQLPQVSTCGEIKRKPRVPEFLPLPDFLSLLKSFKLILSLLNLLAS